MSQEETIEKETEGILERPRFRVQNIRYKEKETKRPEMRIKTWMGILMILSALIVDLLEMAITWLGAIFIGGVLSTILSVGAGFVFWLWFSLLGVSASGNTKKLGVSMATLIVELIPTFDAIPFLSWGWTVGIFFTVLFTRMEDNGEDPTFLGAINEIKNMASSKGLGSKK